MSETSSAFLLTWADRLLRLGKAGLGEDAALFEPAAAKGDHAAFARGFADNLGHRRPTDLFVLSRLLGLTISPDGDTSDVPTQGATTQDDPTRAKDLRAWRAVLRGDSPLPLFDPSGPLVRWTGELSIESWTELEFSCLHALSHAALAAEPDGAGPHSDRVDEAVAWHVNETQPDNGTNHAWATHAFLARHLATGDPDPMLYAQTLVHNALVGGGTADRFNAVLMLDSAAWLRTKAAHAGR